MVREQKLLGYWATSSNLHVSVKRALELVFFGGLETIFHRFPSTRGMSILLALEQDVQLGLSLDVGQQKGGGEAGFFAQKLISTCCSSLLPFGRYRRGLLLIVSTAEIIRIQGPIQAFIARPRVTTKATYHILLLPAAFWLCRWLLFSFVA